jgi:hypothetical protein
MFPYCNICKFTWTSPDGKPYSWVDHVLIGKWQHPIIIVVRSFVGVGCDTDYYLVVTKVRERERETVSKYMNNAHV